MKKGFTLIELMIVIVILGILMAIAIPNFYKLVYKAKAASVVANMHTAQITVETEAIDNNQKYFPNISSFVDKLPNNFKNPFGKNNVSIINKGENKIMGVVEYEGNLTFYTIRGYGKDLDNSLLILNPSSHSF